MLDKNNIPRHIAIIIDGNGRWAKEKGLPRTAGHREGIKRIKEIVRASADLGVEVLTFFGFSSENWSRPRGEISVLMRLLDNFLGREIEELHRNNARFKWIGRADPLPKYLQDKLKEAEDKTKDNTGLVVALALNYGSRQEIVDAAKAFTRQVLESGADPEGLTVESFGDYLYTAGLPDPDLLIRTSGEIRVSNFLLWQISYAELYFPGKCWPDFKRADLEKAIKEYQNRERRFGRVS